MIGRWLRARRERAEQVRLAPIKKEWSAKRGEAMWRWRTGKTDRACELAEAAEALFAQIAAEDPERGKMAASMADLMREMGRLADAERLIKESLVRDRGNARVGANELGTREMFLAQMLEKQGRFEEAEVHVLRAIEAPFGEIQFSHAMLERIRDALGR